MATLRKFKHKEDVEMYIQLPYYDDFQGYDLGWVGTLNQVDRKIYASFHNPSWGNFTTSFVIGESHKGTFMEINAIGENDKGDFKQERTFGRVAKIPHFKHI